MISRLFLVILLLWLPADSEARSYSTGSRSFSAGRSSAPSRSFSPGRSSTSGSGRTYSSGSSSSRSPTSSPSSGRSYSSGSSSSKPLFRSGPAGKPSTSPKDRRETPSFSFDTAAARAQKEAASKRSFASWKESNERAARTPGAAPSSQARGASASRPAGSYSGSYGAPAPVLAPQDYANRPVRVEHVYRPYYSRPLVVFNDSYNSFFWWWLLDRSLDDRAAWAYHHRASMDAARYQALLASDTNLEARVRDLETQQTPVNPRYVPTGLDPDLMYSDHSVQRAYTSRPTAAGRLFFWLILIPTVAGAFYVLVWLVFIKRWQTAAA